MYQLRIYIYTLDCRRSISLRVKVAEPIVETPTLADTKPHAKSPCLSKSDRSIEARLRTQSNRCKAAVCTIYAIGARVIQSQAAICPLRCVDTRQPEILKTRVSICPGAFAVPPPPRRKVQQVEMGSSISRVASELHRLYQLDSNRSQMCILPTKIGG